jgi:glutathionyl-hydroquinone reductase
MTDTTPFASPADVAVHGEYRIKRSPDDPRPLYRFDGRISTDGSTPFAAEAGRYHIYSGWFCPWAQRTVITRSLAGLDDVVSLSYVDNRRDARGWGFRETYGPDPVNGFTLLRDAYDATEPGFDGHVSVPTLWDRVTGTVVSNTFTNIGIDLATKFGALAEPLVATYPADLAPEIDALDEWLLPVVNQGAHAAGGDGPEALAARERLLDAFGQLDARLADQRFLLGDRLTEADVRLFVTLARFDVGPNANRAIVEGLHVYPNLWGYARDLYSIDAFQRSTDFSTFTAPGAVLADWNEPSGRRPLVAAGAS